MGKHLLKLGSGNGMVEVDVLSKPLDGGVSVAVSDQSQVDGVDILHSALHTHKLVRRFKGSIVAECNCQWLPSLHDFWVKVICHIQVFINLAHDSMGHFTLSLEESQQKYDLQVAVVGFIHGRVVRRGGSVPTYIAISKSCRFNGLVSREVEGLGREAGSFNPESPVDGVQDCVGQVDIAHSGSHKLCPGALQLLVGNAASVVLVDVVSEEVLDGCVVDVGSDQLLLEEDKELEALFVGNIGEGVVRRGTVEHGEEAGVGVVRAIVHVVVGDIFP